MDKIKNEYAVVNIDLMFALMLVVGAIFLAYQIMPTISHDDRDQRIRQYMATVRATDTLIYSQGDSGWEDKWKNGNYSNITKIGFLYVENGKVAQNVLNKTKVDALMLNYTDAVIDIPGTNDTIGTNTMWWEFPGTTTSIEEKENASRTLGLEEYSFYMQLHPIELDKFNLTSLSKNLSDVKGINLDTASVIDRYVYIKSNGEYLKYKGNTTHYRLNMWVW